MGHGFCLAGTPVAFAKRSAGIARPIEHFKAQAIFPLDQSLDDQEAEEKQEGDEPVEEEKRWEEYANKHDY